MTSASASDPVFEGVYGPYRITAEDRREVLGYRLALFTAAIAQAALLLQWQRFGGSWLWPWLSRRGRRAWPMPSALSAAGSG